MTNQEFQQQANFLAMAYGYGSQEYKEFMGDKWQPMHFNEEVELTEEEATETVKENIEELKNAGCYHSNYIAFHLEGNIFAWGERHQAIWKEVKSLARQYPSLDYDIQEFYHWSEWELKEMDYHGDFYKVVEDNI